MKHGPPNHHSRDARLDDNDPLWRLLAQAPPRQPDAWFTVRTLAQCRSTDKTAQTSLRFFWRWALGGGLGAALAVVLIIPNFHSRQVADAGQTNVQEAFQIVASIDTDTDTDSTPISSWQDSSM